MGILMEVIDWADPSPDDMINRYPEKGTADIKLGAQLVCYLFEDKGNVLVDHFHTPENSRFM